MIEITQKIQIAHGPAGRRRISKPRRGLPEGRVPRITKLMALAIRFDGLLRDGTVKDRVRSVNRRSAFFGFGGTRDGRWRRRRGAG